VENPDALWAAFPRCHPDKTVRFDGTPRWPIRTEMQVLGQGPTMSRIGGEWVTVRGEFGAIFRLSGQVLRVQKLNPDAIRTKTWSSPDINWSLPWFLTYIRKVVRHRITWAWIFWQALTQPPFRVWGYGDLCCVIFEKIK